MNTKSGKAPMMLTDLAQGNQPNKGWQGKGWERARARGSEYLTQQIVLL